MKTGKAGAEWQQGYVAVIYCAYTALVPQVRSNFLTCSTREEVPRLDTGAVP